MSIRLRNIKYFIPGWFFQVYPLCWIAALFTRCWRWINIWPTESANTSTIYFVSIRDKLIAYHYLTPHGINMHHPISSMTIPHHTATFRLPEPNHSTRYDNVIPCITEHLRDLSSNTQRHPAPSSTTQFNPVPLCINQCHTAKLFATRYPQHRLALTRTKEQHSGHQAPSAPSLIMTHKHITVLIFIITIICFTNFIVRRDISSANFFNSFFKSSITSCKIVNLGPIKISFL